MIVSHIVAMAKNNVIGKGADIPWKIKGEQIRFKELTLNKTIIMGRKTYESIGFPLPNRRTIVISSSLDIPNVEVVDSIESAFELVNDHEEVFIAGGGQLYQATLELIDKIYLTVIDREIEGDIYYPSINMEDFILTYEEHIDGDIPYIYYTLEKRK